MRRLEPHCTSVASSPSGAPPHTHGPSPRHAPRMTRCTRALQAPPIKKTPQAHTPCPIWCPQCAGPKHTLPKHTPRIARCPHVLQTPLGALMLCRPSPTRTSLPPSPYTRPHTPHLTSSGVPMPCRPRSPCSRASGPTSCRSCCWAWPCSGRAHRGSGWRPRCTHRSSTWGTARTPRR